MKEPVQKIKVLHKAGSSPEAHSLLLNVLERRAEKDKDHSLARYVKRERKALTKEG